MRIFSYIVLAFIITDLVVYADQTAFYDRSNDKHEFTVFMQEGGWCWYQDPRAIAHREKLFIGAIRGNENGEAQVGIYDLKARKPIGIVTMHSRFDKDDHNSPVFYAGKNGSVLAVYARHGKDLYHHSRVSGTDNPMQWSDESRHLHGSAAEGASSLCRGTQLEGTGRTRHQ